MYGTSMGPTGPGTFLIAASSKAVFAASADCGACYEITSVNGTSVTVMVVDECTDSGVCDTSFPHLDLAPQAFNYLQNPSVSGVTDTQARRVACPVNGGIKLAVGTNFFSGTEWEILIFNHRTLIRAVSFTYPGQSTPISLPRQTYNYWRYSGPGVTYPVTISVTDINGNVVTFQPLTLTSGLNIENTASPNQFPVPAVYPDSPADQCPPPLGYSPDGWIYTDQLTKEYNDPALAYINTFQWSDWSYGCTVNWAYTTNPYSGSDCVQANIQGRGGIQIGRATSFAWQGAFTSLQFSIKGDIAFNGIAVFWKGSPKQVAVPVTTSWQLITLDLSADLAAPAQIGGQQAVLVFQNTLGNDAPTIYLDSIRLVPVTDSSTSGSSNNNPTIATSTTTTTTSTSSSISTSSTSGSPINNNNNNNNNNNPAVVSTATTTTTTTSPSTSSSTSTSGSPSGTQTSGNSGTVACSVSLSQVSSGGWADGADQYSQWSVTLTNLPQNGKTLTFIDLAPSPSQASSITQFWSVTQSNGNYELPSWITQWGGLSPSQSLNWGYVAKGTEQVNFQITSAQCL